MRLIGRQIIAEFQAKHADSRNALNRWVKLVEGCGAKNLMELRQLFPAADQAGAATIFDVGGNKVRVISIVSYGQQQVLVTHVLTHKEYDRNKW